MTDAAASQRRRERPRSPHLQVYRWPVTMLTSIVHRVTGVGLGAGVLLVVWWLVAAAAGPGPYNDFLTVSSHFLGRIVLFGFTWALVFHALNGVRHLVWDVGYNFENKRAERSGIVVIALSILLTLAVWAFAYWSMGAF